MTTCRQVDCFSYEVWLFINKVVALEWILFKDLILPASTMETPWRNGSASDSISEGCVFKSRRGQSFFLNFYHGVKDAIQLKSHTLNIDSQISNME